ncbi:hypothetical protein WA026_001218 [Henosepilachna vigintioctopunctata]|uniref:NADP-dependent oxidoreductase domain-containing protein n=1 Tax=Henosepilachna vigintioctopunctata TaxID=420089 RepID=A0AAW1UPR1_9CUCU
MKTVTLNSGHQIPVVGLGTWRAKPEEIENAIDAALEQGYRHIDTAFNYNTEEAIGKVMENRIRDGKIKRGDVFITTKLPNVGNRSRDVEKFLNMSLERLKMNYVDLYLIHMPFSFFGDEESYAPLKDNDGSVQLDVNANIVETWGEMEQQVEKGRTRSIGLSNFNMEQVERICKSCKIVPSVLQVELHAYLQQKELVEKCKELGIVVTAYSPLGSPGANQHFSSKYNYTIDDFPDILGHPTVQNLAQKYSKSAGQILLRHSIQRGIVVIPKSLNPNRIKDNINIFDFGLFDQDVQALDALDRGERGRIFDFLFFKGVELHPEYPFKHRFIENTLKSM